MNKEIINEQKNTIHRLQQECTEKTNAIIALSEQLKRLELKLKVTKADYEASEQESEELKEQFKLAKPLYQSCNIKDKKIKKLKQTLVEIKEITKNMNKECFYNDFSCDDCDMIKRCTYKGKLSVLQKISEVEDD